ncbi:TniQ family protein [Kitasatospora sp. NPDC004531]
MPTTQDVRPLPAESTASWLARLAEAHHLPPPYLLDGLNITTTGRPGHTPGGSEIHLDHTAQHHLAAFTRVPHHHLTRALPRLNALPPSHRPPRPPRRPRHLAKARSPRGTRAGLLRLHPAPHPRHHQPGPGLPARPHTAVSAPPPLGRGPPPQPRYRRAPRTHPRPREPPAPTTPRGHRGRLDLGHHDHHPLARPLHPRHPHRPLAAPPTPPPRHQPRCAARDRLLDTPGP